MTDTPGMVERVARVLCWKNGMNPDLTLGGDGENFLWHEYEDEARAAIEAMREPTQGMIEAGCAECDYDDWVPRIYKAMINEALK